MVRLILLTICIGSQAFITLRYAFSKPDHKPSQVITISEQEPGNDRFFLRTESDFLNLVRSVAVQYIFSGVDFIFTVHTGTINHLSVSTYIVSLPSKFLTYRNFRI